MGSLVDCIRKYYPEYLGYSSYPADQCAAFSKSDEEWGILGNMTSAKIVVDGVEFKTSEQLYQMMKFKDPEVVKKVWNGDTARGKKSGNTKMTAKSYEPERSRGKFIVEKHPNPKRRNPDTWSTKLKGDKWEGPNLMGRLLMELRDSNGELEYKLPDDAFEFIKIIKELKK